MNRINPVSILVCFLLSVPFILHAGEKLPKFGKIDESFVSSNSCPIDSSAHAYYVFDIGEDYFDYNTTDGFVLKQQRHFMIKILDETAFDWADIEIPLYQDNGTDDKVFSIKAVTYNIEGEEVVESKLDKDNIFRDKRSEHWDITKFTMPDVKAGSVIEVSYTVSSIYYYNLDEWTIQSTIPILNSYYNVRIPEYFIYNRTQRGYLTVKWDTSYKNGNITFPGGQRVDYTENSYTVKKENVPAFKVEGYLRTPANYITAVEFELSRIEYPNQAVKHYATTWEKVNKQLLEHASIGQRLKWTGFANDFVDQLKGQDLRSHALLHEAFKKIQHHYTWDGKRSIYTSGSLKSTYNDKQGNSADINYALVVLLKELGFHACPILVSTTDHGVVMPTNPSISSFNYAVAGVEIDGVYHYMDATDKFSEIDLLPYRCLNYKGRTIEYGNCNWVDMTPQKINLSQRFYQLKMDDTGILTGTVKYTDAQYAAYNRIKAIKTNGTEEEYIKQLEKEYGGLEIESFSFNAEQGSEKFVSQFEVSIKDAMQSAGDLILLNPLLFHAHEENPFKMENREYPVEFQTPMQTTISIMLELPKGITLEETPAPLRVTLPDKSCYYLYSVKAIGNRIAISTSYKRTKCQYLPAEYPLLKQFYNEMVAKEQTSLILKRTTEISSVE